MKIIKNGRIITPEGELTSRILVFSDKIEAIESEGCLPKYPGAEVIDAEGALVSPGLIDLHIHGFKGNDASDADEEGLKQMSKDLLQNGVTAFLPTTMTIPLADIENAFDAVRCVMKQGTDGAVILGVNAEGPFISSDMKGAQAEENIRKPDASFLLRHKDVVKLSIVAPEAEGAAEAVREVRENSSIVISLGHTNADYESSQACIDAGATQATHLFNAMTPFQHRFPGCSGACLADDRVYCEIIADTFHINPVNYQTFYRAKAGKILLITDCTRAGGLPDGEYDLGGQTLTLRGIECRLKDGTVAGSVLCLNKAVNNFYRHTKLTRAEALALATLNPAAVLQDETRGILEKGRRADIVLFDDEFNTQKVFIGGELKYQK